jgi:hypothetical protein
MRGDLAYVPEPERLTLAQRFRLIEIAHETPHAALRDEVIRLLVLAAHPPLVMTTGGEIRPLLPDPVANGALATLYATAKLSDGSPRFTKLADGRWFDHGV